MTAQVPAIRTASIFVDELARNGVKRAVIAPGSRSTPLALALTSHPAFECFSLLDERGAAFFALGLGLSTGEPAALVCTSGTAAANFFPAVVEAAQSGVPLLVLTADRPHELRESGANQTIDQVRLYGRYPRWFQDMPVPESSPPPSESGFLRSVAARAASFSRSPLPGPVHINFPFRKPLEPVGALSADEFPFSSGARADNRPFTSPLLRSGSHFDLRTLGLKPRTLLVAGPTRPDEGLCHALADLAHKTGFPLIADGLSGMRFGPWTEKILAANPQVCAHLEPPEVILQFGGAPTSNALLRFLDGLPAATERVAVQPEGLWQDGHHNLSRLIQGDPELICRAVEEQTPGGSADLDWAASIRENEKTYWQAVNAVREDGFFEGLVLEEVFSALPSNAPVLVGNSNSVRHLDEFVRVTQKQLAVYGLRGASGIDGNLASAFGIGKGKGRKVAVVLGDIAFYHDLNSLLAIRRLGIEAVIVLIHNDGGGIFHRLPVSGQGSFFTDWFLTPHGLDFEPAAGMFGCRFIRSGQDVGEAVREAFHMEGSTIIECRTDSAVHEAARRRIAALVSASLQKK